jgi:HAD superfamily hydrolase (TIGR01490 family)
MKFLTLETPFKEYVYDKLMEHDVMSLKSPLTSGNRGADEGSNRLALAGEGLCGLTIGRKYLPWMRILSMTREMQPEIAFFDMDHTVLAVDCEQTWKNLLVDQGICPEEERALSQHYIDLHAVGEMPRLEYQQFMLRDFVNQVPEELERLARENFAKYVRHEVYPDALKAIERYRDLGIPTVLLSGSNRVLIQPVAEYLRVEDVICTELETREGIFTGRIDGLYRIQENKVSGAIDWCRAKNTHPLRVAFYGDSMSDLPMFEIVGQPFVVNPSERLTAIAKEHGWDILRWRTA